MRKISLPEIMLSDAKSSARVYRLKKQGLIKKIEGKLYTSNLEDSLENITARRLWEIIGLLFPGAIIADRTAIEMKPTKNGEIFVISSKTRPISFGNFTVYPRRGAPALENDIPFMGNMFLMSEPRKYLENMRNKRGSLEISRMFMCSKLPTASDRISRPITPTKIDAADRSARVPANIKVRPRSPMVDSRFLARSGEDQYSLCRIQLKSTYPRIVALFFVGHD
jgi:hypothetical protein